MREAGKVSYCLLGWAGDSWLPRNVQFLKLCGRMAGDVNEDVIPEVEDCRLALLTLSEANQVPCFTLWLA